MDAWKVYIGKLKKKPYSAFGLILLLALPLTLALVFRVNDVRTRASLPNQLEAEDGVLTSSGVSKQSDSNASSDQYIVFNRQVDPTPTPIKNASAYLESCSALDKNNWSSRISPPPNLTMPGYLESVTDPTTGVKITRVSDTPGKPIPNTNYTWKDVCGPVYPKVPAWNADQSILYTHHCISGAIFFDAKDGPNQYKVLYQRDPRHQARWHPTNPDIMYYTDLNQNIVGVIDIPKNEKTVIYTTPESNLTRCNFGNYEGNVSDDGKKAVIFCEDSNLPAHNSTRPGISFFVLDLEQGIRISPLITSWEMPNFEFLDSAVISPSGKYIIAQQDYRKSTTLGYDQDNWWFMHPGTTWGLGHFDIGFDENSREIAFESEGEVVDLVTGTKTKWLNVNYSHYHTSNRNIEAPGWGFADNSINSGLTPVYDGEIIAAQTKPDGLIRRIVHHRSSAVTTSGSSRYDAYPMSTPSPDGTRVFFRSDWGIKGGPVYGFVADIRNVCGQ